MKLEVLPNLLKTQSPSKKVQAKKITSFLQKKDNRNTHIYRQLKIIIP